MIDRYFTAALTFALFIGGTLAIGSELFGMDRPGAQKTAAITQATVVQLPTVVIIGRRTPPASAVASSDINEPGAQRLQ
ncbi:MAG: hypothetical protein ABL916_10890 [Burkholderiaceae bacterium]